MVSFTHPLAVILILCRKYFSVYSVFEMFMFHGSKSLTVIWYGWIACLCLKQSSYLAEGLGSSLSSECKGFSWEGGGGTRSGKGYQLWSDRCGAVAVATQDG